MSITINVFNENRELVSDYPFLRMWKQFIDAWTGKDLYIEEEGCYLCELSRLDAKHFFSFILNVGTNDNVWDKMDLQKLLRDIEYYKDCTVRIVG
jgi:hypothetical protein